MHLTNTTLKQISKTIVIYHRHCLFYFSGRGGIVLEALLIVIKKEWHLNCMSLKQPRGGGGGEIRGLKVTWIIFCYYFFNCKYQKCLPRKPKNNSLYKLDPGMNQIQKSTFFYSIVIILCKCKFLSGKPFFIYGSNHWKHLPCFTYSVVNYQPSTWFRYPPLR